MLPSPRPRQSTIARRIAAQRAEPFALAAFASGRPNGLRIPTSPHHGKVDICVVSGPNKGTGVRLDWQAAKDFARALRSPAHALRPETVVALRVLHLEHAVEVERLVQGDRFAHWWRLTAQPGSGEAGAALLRTELGRIADHITNAACQAEADQPAVAMRVAYDQAELARSGFPLGLTHDPAILEEARKIHDTDPKLRQYAQTSRLETSIALPLPKLKMGPADPAAALRAQAETMTDEEQRDLLRILEQRLHGG